jgi:hypothetical protein
MSQKEIKAIITILNPFPKAAGNFMKKFAKK